MHINYKDGKISSIKTNIRSEDIKNEKGKNRFLNLMKYFTEYFITELELNQADKLIDYATKNNIDISNAFIISHSNGKALCNVYQYNKNIEVKPFISLSSSDFLSGWTFETGNFSDVMIYTNDLFDGFVSLITKDTLYYHDLFLHWLMNNIENEFYTNNMYKNYVKEHNCWGKEVIKYYPIEDYSKFLFLIPIVENIVNKNKSIRIDNLKINGKKALDYIKENKIFQYANTQNQLFHMCFYFGKPYDQVKKYIENHPVF